MVIVQAPVGEPTDVQNQSTDVTVEVSGAHVPCKKSERVETVVLSLCPNHEGRREKSVKIRVMHIR